MISLHNKILIGKPILLRFKIEIRSLILTLRKKEDPKLPESYSIWTNNLVVIISQVGMNWISPSTLDIPHLLKRLNSKSTRESLTICRILSSQSSISKPKSIIEQLHQISLAPNLWFRTCQEKRITKSLDWIFYWNSPKPQRNTDH